MEAVYKTSFNEMDPTSVIYAECVFHWKCIINGIVAKCQVTLQNQHIEDKKVRLHRY